MTIGLRVVALLIVMPLFGGCATKSAELMSENQQIQAALVNQSETQAAISSEADILKASVSHAVRKEGSLSLTLTSGQSVTLKNEDSGCPHPPSYKLEWDHCYNYVLMAYLPSEHFFLVGQFLDESASFLLIDDCTGKRTITPAVPQFSPDHTRFLVINNNEMGDAGLVQIWARKGDSTEIEWRHQFARCPCKLISWTSNRIELDIYVPPSVLGHPELHYPAILTRNALGWHAETQAPEAKKSVS